MWFSNKKKLQAVWANAVSIRERQLEETTEAAEAAEETTEAAEAAEETTIVYVRTRNPWVKWAERAWSALVLLWATSVVVRIGWAVVVFLA